MQFVILSELSRNLMKILWIISWSVIYIDFQWSVFLWEFKIQRMRCWKSEIAQWNRIEKPRNRPTKIKSTNFWQRSEAIQWRKGSHFNKWCSEQFNIHMQKDESRHRLIPLTKINSKYITDLNINMQNYIPRR